MGTFRVLQYFQKWNDILRFKIRLPIQKFLFFLENICVAIMWSTNSVNFEHITFIKYSSWCTFHPNIHLGGFVTATFSDGPVLWVLSLLLEITLKLWEILLRNIIKYKLSNNNFQKWEVISLVLMNSRAGEWGIPASVCQAGGEDQGWEVVVQEDHLVLLADVLSGCCV